MFTNERPSTEKGVWALRVLYSLEKRSEAGAPAENDEASANTIDNLNLRLDFAPSFTPSESHTAVHVITRRQKHSGNVIGLRFASLAPNAASTPFFWTGSTISGTLSLDLPPNSPEKDRIKAITLDLKCVRVVSGSKGTSADLGDAAFERNLVVVPVTLHGSQDDLGEVGDESTTHVWSWSVDIPTSYESHSKARPNTMFPLPPTFSRGGFQEFYKHELEVKIKKGLLWSNEQLLQTLIVLPRSTPPKLPSPYLLAAYEHNLPLPLPFTAPGAWSGKGVSLTARIGNVEADVLLKMLVAEPICHARGTPIPICLSLTVQSVTPIASGSSSSGPGVILPSSVYTHVYNTLRFSLQVSLEALYPMGGNGSTGFFIDRPMHIMPHPSEIGAEVIVEQVAPSSPLWDADLAYSATGVEDVKDVKDEKGPAVLSVFGTAGWPGLGVESWLQGEIISNGNIMPDFVAPSLRLTHAVSLRVDSSRALIVGSITPPPSANIRKMYMHFATPPLITLPVIITTHSLPGDSTRSIAPVPRY